MKKLIILFFTVVLLNCEKKLVQPNDELGTLFIEIENHFDNDLVKLELDANTLLNGRITTDYTISLAWATQKQLPKGWHIIEISLPEIPRHEMFAFETSDTLTVLIRYDLNKDDIDIQTTQTRIFRD